MPDYPDFTIIAKIKGDYGGADKAVAVDVDGNLCILLYGTYAGANKKILTDVDGNVRMNLYAQDLDEVINRFKYGAPMHTGLGQGVGAGMQEILETVYGKGLIYLVTVYLNSAVTHKDDYVWVNLDSMQIMFMTFEELWQRGYTEPFNQPFFIRQFDDIGFNYAVSGLPGYTFETSCQLCYANTSVASQTVFHIITYALV